MNTNKMKVRLTFVDNILGTLPSNEKVYEDYIASKAPDANTMTEEIEAFGVDATIEKGTTVFHKIDGKPYLYDYQIRGFFKGAADALVKCHSYSNKVMSAYTCKKFVDQQIFVTPRNIAFDNAQEIEICQRPLRAQTMQGERVALAMSESIPSGCSIEFEIMWLPQIEKVKKKTGEVTPAIDVEQLICEWLDYGRFSGLGQWRNSGCGRFTWERIEL